MKEMSKLLEKAKPILSNLLIFADFENVNGQARAYHILKATVDKLTKDFDHGHIEYSNEEDKKLNLLYSKIALKKAIKNSQRHLKTLTVDLSNINKVYFDKSKINNIVHKIKSEFKSKVIKCHVDFDDISIHMDDLVFSVFYDVNSSEPYLKISNHFSKFVKNDDVINSYISELKANLKKVNVNYNPRIAKSLKIYEKETIVEYYLMSSNELVFGETELNNYNNDFVFKLIAKDISNKKLFDDKTEEDIYLNLEDYIKIEEIKKY